MQKLLMGLAVVLAVGAGAAVAQDAGPFAQEIKARQGIMQYRALHLGILGAMAKEEAEYNAEAAQQAADAIAYTAGLDESMLWPEGSDNSANPASTASPDAWSETSDVMAKHEDFVTASMAMKDAAGGGLDALKEAMGPLGASCGGCHKTNRIPMN